MVFCYNKARFKKGQQININKGYKMSTFEKVKKIVHDKLGVEESKITETSSFVNDSS